MQSTLIIDVPTGHEQTCTYLVCGILTSPPNEAQVVVAPVIVHVQGTSIKVPKGPVAPV